MPETPNHRYNVPKEGDQDWDEPLNENFRQYDTDIEIRDQPSNRDQYEPKDGAKFFGTENGKIYIGNGSEWTEIPTTGTLASFDGVEVKELLTVNEFLECQNQLTTSLLDVYRYLQVTGDDGELAAQITGNVSGKATSANHVLLIENIADGGSEDVLALRMNEDPPGNGNNYISFKDTNDDSMGAIEGDGDGGVTMAGPGNDYAEWLPRADDEQSFDAGDVVGIHGGEVRLQTDGADRVMVVSTHPIVTGNDPGPEISAREAHEKIAFVGQALAKVRGTVETGDMIIPSGENDGTGRAVATADYRPAQGPVVGRAWEESSDEGVTELTVAVGIETGDALEAAVEAQADRIDDLEARLAALETQIGADTAAHAD